MPSTLRRLMVLAPLLASLAAQAASLGELEVASHLGEPLRLTVPVTLDEGALPLDICGARIVGPSAHHPDLVDATIDLVTRNNRHFLTISTRRPVLDPMFDLTLRADDCGLSMQKDYLVLLSPSDYALPTVPVVAPVAAAATTEGVRPAPAKKPRVSGKRTGKRGKKRGQHAGGTYRGTASAAPAAVTAAPARPEGSRGEPPAGDRLVLTAPNEEQSVPAQSAAPAAAETTAGKAADASERGGLLTNVDGNVAKPPPGSQSWLAWATLVLVLVAASAAVSFWLGRRSRPRPYRVEPTLDLDTGSPNLEPPVRPARPARPLQPAVQAPAPEPMPEPARPARPAPRLRPELEAAGLDLAPLSLSGIEAKTIQPAEILADETPSIDHVMELAEVMLAFGRSGQAIEALSQHIRDNPHQSVDPWLKLLDLYHQSNLRAEFDALAAELHKHYNVAVTEWTDYATEPSTAAVTLESLPHIMARVTETWASPACLDYLERLLKDNRGGQRLGFAMAIVHDILLLRGILRQTGPAPSH